VYSALEPLRIGVKTVPKPMLAREKGRKMSLPVAHWQKYKGAESNSCLGLPLSVCSVSSSQSTLLLQYCSTLKLYFRNTDCDSRKDQGWQVGIEFVP